MTNNQSNSSNNNQYKNNEYKECACKSPGRHKLIIKFSRMVGWFCKDCKKNLVKMDLKDVGDDDKVMSKISSLPSSTSKVSSFSNTDLSANKYNPSAGNFQPYITHELESMIKTLKIDSESHRISNKYQANTLVAVIDCLIYHHYNSTDVKLLKNFFFEFNQKLENPLEEEELEDLWALHTAFIQTLVLDADISKGDV